MRRRRRSSQPYRPPTTARRADDGRRRCTHGFAPFGEQAVPRWSWHSRSEVVVDAAVVVVGGSGRPGRRRPERDHARSVAEGARRRPAPTDGVGKWLAGAPIVACSRTAPVDGLRPYRTPFWPMVQTSPAATIGGPPPTRRAPQQAKPVGGRRGRHRDRATQAGQVDRRAHDGHATVDVVAAGARRAPPAGRRCRRGSTR